VSTQNIHITIDTVPSLESACEVSVVSHTNPASADAGTPIQRPADTPPAHTARQFARRHTPNVVSLAGNQRADAA
jgi:hypothetical protein